MTRHANANRQAIIDACLDMERIGINQGTSGNISVRQDDGLLITPTSKPYAEMEPQDIVFLRMDGTSEGPLRPSSEWRIHRDIYRERPDVHAIVHAHPIYATTLAIMGRDIPPVHYMVAIFGGATVRCAPYATFGTAELSEHALEALRDRRACLLAHHGIVAAGKTLAHTMWLAAELEVLARQYHGALQIGTPPLLSEEEIARVLDKMREYGAAATETAKPFSR